MNRFLNWVLTCADVESPYLTADQVRAMGGAIPTYLQASGILRRIENALTIQCDGCAEGHVEEVVLLDGKDGTTRAFIPCPENLRVEVPLERLYQWAPDFSRLAAEVIKSDGSHQGADRQDGHRELYLGLLPHSGIPEEPGP